MGRSWSQEHSVGHRADRNRRRRACRALCRDTPQARPGRCARAGDRAEPGGRHLRLRRRLLRPGARLPARRRSRDARPHHPAHGALAQHDARPPGRAGDDRRHRLRRDRPAAPPATAAGAREGRGRGPALRHGAGQRGRDRGRSDRRCGRAELPRARRRARLRRLARPLRQPLRLVRHHTPLRDADPDLRRDVGRHDERPPLPLPAGDEHLHRRVRPPRPIGRTALPTWTRRRPPPPARRSSPTRSRAIP